MSNIITTIEIMKERWGTPQEAVHRGQKCPFPLTCSFVNEPATTLEQIPLSLPKDIRDFWGVSRCANLFKDQQFGQWGIEILTPDEALSETSRQMATRPRDFISSDLVIARFIGDSDLLIIACDIEQSNFGSVTVALPIDRRSVWPVAADTFANFLDKLVKAQGDKYWEINK